MSRTVRFMPAFVVPASAPCPSRDAEWQITAQEEANEKACVATALAEGHTAQEAEYCDGGDVGCVRCPFVDRR